MIPGKTPVGKTRVKQGKEGSQERIYYEAIYPDGELGPDPVENSGSDENMKQKTWLSYPNAGETKVFI